MRENRMRRLTWRELETWPWGNCEPTEPSKELVWKPSTYSARASSRPYLNGEGGETGFGTALCPYPTPTPPACARTSLRLLARLTAGVRLQRSEET